MVKKLVEQYLVIEKQFILTFDIICVYKNNARRFKSTNQLSISSGKPRTRETSKEATI